MYYTIGEVSKLIGKPTTTIRYWENNGVLIPTKVTDGKTRYYSKELLVSVFGEDLNWEKLETGDDK